MPTKKSYFTRPLALLVWAVLAANVIMVVLASPAWAATYTVNSTADTDDGACTTVSGGCTLREAINTANTPSTVADTINFNLGSAATITLTSAQLPTITDTAGLTIDGGSANITISGANKYRVFEVGGGAKLTLNNLTVTNGNSSSDGGGIHNSGTVTVSNSTISGNTADGSGGSICNRGGTVTVTNSTISGNSTNDFGAGGGIFNFNGGTLEVSNSTLSGNYVESDSDGGGIANSYGGGIYNSTDGTVTVSNSTISGNSVSAGGGIINGGTLEVSNSTLSGNSANNGGGTYNDRGTSTLKNTIVAKSPSGGSCSGAITNGGYNLDSGNTCGFGTNNNSLSGVVPMLGPLADNGGPTRTHALLAGSLAIDKGKSFGESTDQRGLVRPSNFVGIVNAADGSDIGAFELQASPLTPPKVKSTIPKANATEVAPTANVKAIFSEEMKASTINGTTFKLFKKGTTTQIAAPVSYNADAETAKLDPTNLLQRGVAYKAVVTTWAKDVEGNRLDQNRSTTSLQQKVWYFEIAD